MKIPGLSFSLKRPLGITQAKQKIVVILEDFYNHFISKQF